MSEINLPFNVTSLMLYAFGLLQHDDSTLSDVLPQMQLMSSKPHISWPHFHFAATCGKKVEELENRDHHVQEKLPIIIRLLNLNHYLSNYDLLWTCNYGLWVYVMTT